MVGRKTAVDVRARDVVVPREFLTRDRAARLILVLIEIEFESGGLLDFVRRHARRGEGITDGAVLEKVAAGVKVVHRGLREMLELGQRGERSQRNFTIGDPRLPACWKKAAAEIGMRRIVRGNLQVGRGLLIGVDRIEAKLVGTSQVGSDIRRIRRDTHKGKTGDAVPPGLVREIGLIECLELYIDHHERFRRIGDLGKGGAGLVQSGEFIR